MKKINNIKNSLNENYRIIISQKKLINFNLISRIKLPKYYRYTKSDIIYFYE